MLYLATFYLYYQATNNSKRSKKVNIHSVSDSFHRIVKADNIDEVEEKLIKAYPNMDIISLDISRCL